MIAKVHSLDKLGSCLFLQMVALLVNCSLAMCSSLPSPLIIEMRYETKRDSNGDLPIDKALLSIGYDAQDTHSPVGQANFFPLLSAPFTLSNLRLPQSPQPQWGFFCETKKWNPKYCCNYTDKIEQTSLYGKSYSTFKAKSFIQLEPNPVSKIEGRELSLNLGDDLNAQNYFFGETSILGLSPNYNNPLWNYLFGLYSFKSNNLVFQLDYQDQKENNYKLYLNGYNGQKLVDNNMYYITQDKQTFDWTFPMVQVSLVDQFSKNENRVTTGVACVTNSYNELLALSYANREKLNRLVSQKICGENSCRMTEGSIQSGPDLFISISLSDGDIVKYRLRPEDYLHDDSGYIKVYAGDLDTWKTNTCSDPLYHIALGRKFLSLSFVVFEIQKTGTKRIGVGEYVLPVRSTPLQRLILTIFISCICVSIIFMGVYQISRSQQEEVLRKTSTFSSGDDPSLYASMSNDEPKD